MVEPDLRYQKNKHLGQRIVAEPFKNKFNQKIIKGMGQHFKNQYPEFDAQGFYTLASTNLEALELKQRSEQIMNAMVEYLPADYQKAGEVILASLSPAPDADIFASTVDDSGIAGWAIMPITHYVGLYGQHHFALSMNLLKELTKRFSSEFGIRFFLLNDPQKTLSVVQEWATDNNRHVRRLASEGIRPRLPWAMQLPLFIKAPSPIINVLSLLKDDEDEYVRRSVANNLNDISKDHPDLVADITEKWMVGANKNRIKLLRHACRTLIKQGHKKALSVFGYHSAEIKQVSMTLHTPEVTLGNTLQFTVSASSNAQHEQPLMIDYVIYHQKANGTLSPKVFKWRKRTLMPAETLSLSKQHPIKKITTRKYYQGLHSIEIMINGVAVAKTDFNLQIP